MKITINYSIEMFHILKLVRAHLRNGERCLTPVYSCAAVCQHYEHALHKPIISCCIEHVVISLPLISMVCTLELLLICCDQTSAPCCLHPPANRRAVKAIKCFPEIQLHAAQSKM